jgi:hypothetical protein
MAPVSITQLRRVTAGLLFYDHCMLGNDKSSWAASTVLQVWAQTQIQLRAHGLEESRVHMPYNKRPIKSVTDGAGPRQLNDAPALRHSCWMRRRIGRGACSFHGLLAPRTKVQLKHVGAARRSPYAQTA